ncbi:MAG: RrF2 family transcriptional regulator [Candidatus Binatia bacterium]
MKVGSKGYYGLLALTELVQSYRARRPVQVKDIAQRQQIPEEYLGQIMVLLKRSNLVHGTRGPGGGYYLARAPESVTVGEVLRLLEGPFVDLDLRANQNRGRMISSIVTRRIMDTWTRGVEALEKVLEETTLADLCRTEERAPMYYI